MPTRMIRRLGGRCARRVRAPSDRHAFGRRRCDVYISQGFFKYQGNDDTVYLSEYGNAIALCTSGTTSTPKCMFTAKKRSATRCCWRIISTKNNKEIINDKASSSLHFCRSTIFGLIAVYMWYTFFGKTLVFIKTETRKSYFRHANNTRSRIYMLCCRFGTAWRRDYCAKLRCRREDL